MKVLLAQVPVAACDVDANLATLRATLAAHPEAELAAFPEMFLPSYETAGVAERAETEDGPLLAAVAEAAREHGTAVVVGVAETNPGGGTYNAAACFDAGGRLAGLYRKTHLFGDGETAAFLPGDRYLVTSLAGARVGVQICFDTEFPEPARAMALGGAELLVTISANMAPYDLEHRLGAAARAIENRLPHVYVNRTGEQAGFTFLGESAAIDSGGRDLVRLGAAPEAVVVDVPIGAETIGEVDYLRLLPPALPVDDRTRAAQPAEAR